MVQGILASASALRAAGSRVNQTAHNLANISTSGYVPRRLNLASQASGGVRVAGSTALGSGPILPSENPLDLAIDGSGFFVLGDGQGGQLYTRSGHFTLNAQGQLVDQSGRAVTPAITVPPEATHVHVSSDGRVQGLGPDGRVLYEAQLQTANFGNPGGLQSVGGNAYRATAASGPAVTNTPGAGGSGQIISGAWQASGTDLVGEIINLVLDQRFFEANLKALETQDKTLGTIIDVVG